VAPHPRPTTTARNSGWIDLDNGVIYRRGSGQNKTNKRQPPVRIPVGLLPHLKRWKRLDEAKSISHVVHIHGRPIAKLRRSWTTACAAAKLDEYVVPHALRHTCATPLMQAGFPIFEAAGFLGMSVEMLTTTYGHHHPDFQNEATQRRGKK
jgi:integrase